MSLQNELITATYPAPDAENQQNSNSSDTNQINTICSFFTPKEAASIFTFAWFFIWFFIVPLTLYQVNNGTFEFKNIALNTVGDYLAGVAAPIAFLWLVLGYKQQGKELAINNKMLSLQYQELQNSVQAQNDQADSLKQQLNLLIREKFFPKYKLSSIIYMIDNDYIQLTIENIGHPVNAAEIIVNSNIMAIENLMEMDNKIYIDLNSVGNIGNQFAIYIKIISTLEIGNTIEECFVIHYNSIKHNHSMDIFPQLEPIKCEGELA